MTSTARKRKAIQLPVAQFVAIIVLSISLFLIVDFGRRAATGYRVHREEERLQTELAAIQTANQTLHNRLDYVQTDAYIEEVARNELKWSRPGETVVVVLATPQATMPAASIAADAVNPPANQPFDAWVSVFFPQLAQTPLADEVP